METHFHQFGFVKKGTLCSLTSTTDIRPPEDLDKVPSKQRCKKCERKIREWNKYVKNLN